MKRITCKKGLAMIRPYSRRRESAYILSYQSLFSVSINRASPEGDFPKCAKEGLAQAPSRGGFQKRYIKPDFCQHQLADCMATLLFPYREVGIKLPTTLKKWQNPGKPGSKRINQMPMMEPSLLLAVGIEKSRDSPLKMPTENKLKHVHLRKPKGSFHHPDPASLASIHLHHRGQIGTNGSLDGTPVVEWLNHYHIIIINKGFLIFQVDPL